MIITIDGPSGTGKSSAAKRLAKRLGYQYYNTGALYRALTAWMLQTGWLHREDVLPTEAFKDQLRRVKMRLGGAISPNSSFQEGEAHYWVEGEDMTSSTQDQSLALLVSRVAAWPCVREYLLTIQRDLGLSGCAIFEGRDMGTVVFPHADLKLFLTAKAQVRAKRRHLEMLELAKSTGLPVPSLQEICEAIEARDMQDAQRLCAPFKASDEAYQIDASDLNLEEVVEAMVILVQLKQAATD